MNIAELNALIKSLQDPNIKKLLKHKDWEAAYAQMIDNEDEHVQDFYDLDDDVQFVHLFTKYHPSVSDKLIWIEDTVPSEPYYWHAKEGEWRQESDDEDEEEDDSE